MQVRVLGCHGGETPLHLPTCLLVDGVLAIDAGSLCRGLKLAEQLKVDDILIGHSHMDHTKDLALLAEQVVGRRETPITIHCGSQTAKALREHYFNNILWPDFTSLPTKREPVVRIKTHRPSRKFTVGKYEITFVPVVHPVESMGMIINDGTSSLVYSSDTGPTEKLWKTANRFANLKAAFVELSFPNSMQELADIAGHFTPFTLALEASKLADDKLAIFLYHLKPAFLAETKRELRALRNGRYRTLAVGDRIQL